MDFLKPRFAKLGHSAEDYPWENFTVKIQLTRSICLYFLLSLLLLGYFSCSAPRSLMQSGRVTPHKDYNAGIEASINISGATLDNLFKGVEADARQFFKDSLASDSSLKRSATTALSYSLDPFTLATGIWIRYGIFNRTDFGFRLSGGTLITDLRYQFLGPTKKSPSESRSMWYGSGGIQYSKTEFTLPSYLGEIQKALGYEFVRRDLLLPFIFSRSLGPEEKYGAVVLGASLQYSAVHYGFKPSFLMNVVNGDRIAVKDVPSDKENYFAYGASAGLKIGHKPWYFFPALAVFYQDFGEYQIFNSQTASISGFTLLPSVSLQVNF